MRNSEHDELPGVDGPGVGRTKIDEIEELAEKYCKIRDKRCEISPKEIAAKTELIEAMKAHRETLGMDEDGTIRYAYGERIITVKREDKLKVKDATEQETL